MVVNGSWIKLPASIGQEPDLGELAAQDGLAAFLWVVSLATANWYGILPGEPRKYRAIVAAAALIPSERVEVALQAQEQAGLIVRYEADGQALVYIPNYHLYHDVNWWKARASEYPLPAEWQMPPKLAEIIESGALKRAHREFGRYGLSGSTLGSIGGGGGEDRGSIGEEEGRIGVT